MRLLKIQKQHFSRNGRNCACGKSNHKLKSFVCLMLGGGSMKHSIAFALAGIGLLAASPCAWASPAVRLQSSMPQGVSVSDHSTLVLVARAKSKSSQVRHSPAPEQIALKEALIKLQVSISQGVNVSDYSGLVLEARTRFELARSKLPESTTIVVSAAIAAAEATKSLWNTTFEDDQCDALCSVDVTNDLIALGLINDRNEYESYMRTFMGSYSPYDFKWRIWRSPIIGRALTSTEPKLMSAIAML